MYLNVYSAAVIYVQPDLSARPSGIFELSKSNYLNRIKHNLFMSVTLTENGRTRYYLEMQL